MHIVLGLTVPTDNVDMLGRFHLDMAVDAIGAARLTQRLIRHVTRCATDYDGLGFLSSISTVTITVRAL